MRLLGVCFGLFVVIAIAVQSGVVGSVDESIRRYFLGVHLPSRVAEAIRDLTALGGYAILTILIVMSVLSLLALQMRREAWLIAVTAIGGTIVSQLLKLIFARDRPELAGHLTAVHTASFPSGHSMMSMAIYLSLSRLAARHTRVDSARFLFLIAGIVIPMMVGLSRVILGVHWLTDVLAGWSLGAFWALLLEWVTLQRASGFR